MIEQWAKWIFAVEMGYLVAVCVSKLAILSIFLRVFTDRWTRVVTYTLFGTVIAAWIAETISGTLQCIPFKFQWDKTITGGHCFNIVSYYQYLSIPNILTDIIMLVLPQPSIWRLHTTRIQKVGLGVVFLAGSIGLIASCVRFAEFFVTDALSDPTWNSVVLLTWTMIEPAIYLVAACLLTYRPLLKKVGDRLHMSVDTASRNSQKPSYARPGSIPLGTKNADGFQRLYDKNGTSEGDASFARGGGRKSPFELSQSDGSSSGRREDNRDIMVTHDFTVTREERV